MRHLNRCILCALFALWAVAAILPAAAQEPGLGVRISPAIIEFDLNQRNFSSDATITNLESEPRRIELRVTGLGHDLDGSPLLIEPSIMRESIELSAREFILQPDESRRVEVTGAIPRGHRGVYAALVALYGEVDEEEEEEEGSRVNVETQVAATYLLRGPRPWTQQVEVVDVGILPGPADGPFDVYAAVRNSGNVHVTPSGRVRILKDGEPVATVLLTGERVIPAFARRVMGRWEPQGELTGRYTLEATIENPDATGVGEVDFSDGTIHRVTGEIVGVVAQGGEITVSYRNTGTVPLIPEIRFSATKEDVEEGSESLEGSELPPGASGSIGWRPDVDPGLYVITAQLTAEGEVLDQQVTGLEVAGRDMRTLVIGGIAAVLLALLVVATVVYRRRHPRERARPTRRRVTKEPAIEPEGASDADAGLAAVEAARAAADAALQAARAAQDAAAALSARGPRDLEATSDEGEERSGPATQA